MNGEWYYSHDGVTRGPFSAEQIQEQAIRRILSENDRIWQGSPEPNDTLSAESVLDFATSPPTLAPNPDWLQDVAKVENQTSLPDPVVSDDVLDWLEDLRLWVGLDTFVTVGMPASTSDTGPLPDWLAVPATISAPARPSPHVQEHPEKMKLSEPPKGLLADKSVQESGYEPTTGQILDRGRFQRWLKSAHSQEPTVTNKSLFAAFRQARLAVENWIDDESRRPLIVAGDLNVIKRDVSLSAIFQNAQRYGPMMQEKLWRHLAFMVANRRKYYAASALDTARVPSQAPTLKLPPGNKGLSFAVTASEPRWILGAAAASLVVIALAAFFFLRSSRLDHAQPENQLQGSPASPFDDNGSRQEPSPEKLVKETMRRDPDARRKSYAIPAHRENWDLGLGQVQEENETLVVDNDGGRFWLISKENLPENFQLVFKCRLEALEGRQKILTSQRDSLRTLTVHFGSEDTSQKDQAGGGVYFRFSNTFLHLYREGDIIKTTPAGNSSKAFLVSLTKNGSEYVFEVDDQVVMRHRDEHPLVGSHKFSIGGYLSRLHLGEVVVNKGGGYEN